MADSRFLRRAAVGLLPLGAAEVGVRLLAPRQTVPPAAEVSAGEYFEPAEIRRGADYARPQRTLALLKEVLRLGVLAGLTVRGRRSRSGSRRAQPVPPAAAGAIGALRLLATNTAVALPVAIVQRRRAMAVGLDTQAWRGWWADLAKASAIGTALSAGAGASVSALIARYPRGWWAPAALAAVGFGGVGGTLAPILLDPLFNDFTPLPEGEMRAAVLELARGAGVKVGEVFSVDASRRTTGANAYVAGLGPTKRVVLFDTLLDRYTGQEVGVVVAHEFSHVRHRDVLRLLALSALVAPAAALAVQRLSWLLMPEAAPADTLPALALSGSLVMGPVGIVAGRLSRAIERRCDAESLELSDAPEAFIAFQRAIAIQNVGDVEPPRWVRVLLASHPPTLERIGAAVAYRSRRAA